MKLLDNVKDEFPEFWNIEIAKDGHEYHKTSFDAINTSLLIDRLAENSSHDDLAMVLPKDPTVTPIIIIESLLALLKYELLSSSDELIESLKDGDDAALIDSNRKITPVTFMGIEYKNDEKGYRVKDNCISTWIPSPRRWRIRPYYALQKGKKKRSSKAYGEQLELAMGLQPGGLMGLQRLKGIIVTANKSKLRDEIKEFTIGGESIEKVFPMADYTDLETPKPFFNDRIGRDFVLSVVSHTDIAADIALKDDTYKFIIIEGAAKVRNSYGGINLLNSDKNPRKIICLLNTTDEDEINTLKNMGMTSFVWKHFDFNNHCSDNRLSDDVNMHEQIINAIGSSEKIIKIIDSPSTNLKLENMIFLINKLISLTPDGEDASVLLRRILNLYFFFLHLPFCIKDYERIQSSSGLPLLIDLIEKLKNDISSNMGSVFSKDTEFICRDISNLASELYVILENQNPRYNLILEALVNNNTITFVCPRDDFKMVLSELPAIKDSGAIIVSKNELSMNPMGCVYYCGYFSRKSIAKTFLAPYRSVIFQFYEHEHDRYNSVIKNHSASPYSRVDRELRGDYSLPLLDLENLSIENNNKIIESVDIEKCIETFNTERSKYSEWKLLESSNNVNVKTTLAYRVKFESDFIVFADKSYKFKKIDRDINEIVKEDVLNLEQGDEIIFTNNTKDLFEDFIKEIKLTKKYVKLNEISSLWWKLLLQYKNENALSIDELTAHLKLAGCGRNSVTIRNWVSGDTIVPLDPENSIRAIVRLTNDQYLKDHISDIINSSKVLHALHINAGRSLIRCIINSVVTLGDEVDVEIQSTICQFLKSATIGVVDSVGSEEPGVPSNIIGELIDTVSQI